MSEKVPVTTKMEPPASLLLLFTSRENGSANSWIDMKKQVATFEKDLLLLLLPAPQLYGLYDPRLYDKTLYTYSYVAVYGLCVSRNRRRTRTVRPILRILAQMYGVRQEQLVIYKDCRLPIQRLAVSMANDKPSTIFFGVYVSSSEITVIFGKSQSSPSPVVITGLPSDLVDSSRDQLNVSLGDIDMSQNGMN